MTFKALLRYIAASQHSWINRTMWFMTSGTSFDSHWSMFIAERAALVGMAFQTTRFIAAMPRRCGQRLWLKRSMRVMAIDTIHLPLLQFMGEGFGKLRAGLSVTTHALRVSIIGWLHGLGGGMNVVATKTSHFATTVTRADTPHLGSLILMAGKACRFPRLSSHLSWIAYISRVSRFSVFSRIAMARIAGLLHTSMAIFRE